MKNITIITPVPDLINIFIKNSMLRKAIENNVVQINVMNLREYGKGKYRQIDDNPYGGGSGMLMMVEPLCKALEHAIEQMDNSNVVVLYPTAQGKIWNQESAVNLSQYNNIIVICGHYKGIDERVIEKYVTHEYSIGDFIMTSGELPAMLMLDSAVRLIPGTLNNIESALTDTFTYGLLDHPHYAYPRSYQNMNVPEVLISGHHKNIDSWKQEQREKRTKERRLDLWEKYTKLKEIELENNNEQNS